MTDAASVPLYLNLPQCPLNSTDSMYALLIKCCQMHQISWIAACIVLLYTHRQLTAGHLASPSGVQPLQHLPQRIHQLQRGGPPGALPKDALRVACIQGDVRWLWAALAAQVPPADLHKLLA